jgi:hypothetical protein
LLAPLPFRSLRLVLRIIQVIGGDCSINGAPSLALPRVPQGFCRLFGRSLSVCSAKWSPLGLMDVALDTIIVRIVIYSRESEKRSTVDATASKSRGTLTK